MRVLPGEHPDRVPVRPPLDHRQAELVDVEPLRPLQLGDLEHELGHAGDGGGWHVAQSN